MQVNWRVWGYITDAMTLMDGVGVLSVYMRSARVILRQGVTIPNHTIQGVPLTVQGRSSILGYAAPRDRKGTRRRVTRGVVACTVYTNYPKV